MYVVRLLEVMENINFDVEEKAIDCYQFYVEKGCRVQLICGEEIIREFVPSISINLKR